MKVNARSIFYASFVFLLFKQYLLQQKFQWLVVNFSPNPHLCQLCQSHCSKIFCFRYFNKLTPPFFKVLWIQSTLFIVLGITYDRKDIEEHLQRVGHFDPVTRWKPKGRLWSDIVIACLPNSKPFNMCWRTAVIYTNLLYLTVLFILWIEIINSKIIQLNRKRYKP